MRVSRRHILHQGPVVRALLRAAVRRPPTGGGKPVYPGPVVTATLEPRPSKMVREYILHTGGDPYRYRGVLPPHLFPQWGFPILAESLGDQPYDLRRMLNAGCRMEVRGPLAADRPLDAVAQLLEVDDDGRRALFKYRLITGTDEVPEALQCDITALVPLPKKSGGDAPAKKKKKKKDPVLVPEGAAEVHRWKLGPKSGRDYALLTGDINPIHWVAPYAKMAGFRNTIAHGFSGLARLYESLAQHRALEGGDPVSVLEVRFVKPMLLPADVGVFVDGDACSVGDAPGEKAYFTGTFE